MTAALLALIVSPGAWAAPAAAPAKEPATQSPADDLGIPTSPPWEPPANAPAARARGAAAAGAAAASPLEVRFWERLDADSAALERWRQGLLQGAWFALGQPQVFRPAGAEPLYDEYRDTARRTWVRSMDYWLALDSLVARYGRFGELRTEEERAAAFALGYAAYLAQSRFVREWTAVCGGRTALEKLFDEPVPELGLPAGGYSRIKGRTQGKGSAVDREAAWRYLLRLGGAKALARVRGLDQRAWDRARSEDAAMSLRQGAGRRKGAAPPPGKDLLAGTFPLMSAAEEWVEGTGPTEEEVPSLMPPALDWDTASVSSRVVYSLDAVRHWLRMDISTASRPDSFISAGQVSDLAVELEPGDILLARRGGSLGEIGLAGFWHMAGLYAGTPAERKKYFGSSELDTALQGGMPAAYAANVGVSKSTASAAPVLTARPGGAGFVPLPAFAAADALAVLRPRLGRPDKAEALRRAFACFGRPYDYRYDARSEAALTGAELVAKAYQASRTAAGLNLPLEESLGAWTIPANSLARKFDAEFGTASQELDWVLFLDEDKGLGGFGRARRATLEEFRASWRRPKWALREEDVR